VFQPRFFASPSERREDLFIATRSASAKGSRKKHAFTFSRANRRKVNISTVQIRLTRGHPLADINRQGVASTPMKTLRFSVFFLLGPALFAQATPPPVTTPQPTTPAATAQQATGTAAPTSVRRTAQELEQLLAPIALYPDALIALILPAATVPTDIVLAARHVTENPGDRSQIEHRAWDESVKSLTNYAEVLQWMDENLHWTQQVGEAFAAQPADVMQAIQRLREKARAAGTLVDTPQQQVLTEAQVIRIVPAQPDVIYVPHYEPEIVFVDRPVYYNRPFLTFGTGVFVGSWLAYDCDWRRNSIWIGNRHRHWSGHDWRRPIVHHSHSPGVRQWHPPAVHSRSTFTSGHRFRSEIVRPAPISITGTRTHPQRYGDGWGRRTGPNSPPVINPLPQASTNQPQRDFTGPRAANTRPAIVNPPTAQVTPPTAVPNLQPLPQARRPRDDSNGNNESRGRSFRGNQANSASPPTVVPSLPMATPVQSSPRVGPTAQQRSFSRPTTIDSAPARVPSLPMANRSAGVSHAPATVAPAPAPAAQPAAAPAAAPAAQRSEGESRGQRNGNGGHRGSGTRRDAN
jgi:hypothetical protein